MHICNYKNIKSNRGVTLTSLVIYIIVFIIVITIVANISDNFYKNVGEIQDSPKYISEFNKFSMFFIADVKRNTEIISISDTELELADGTKYVYQNNSIYRNDEEIAKYVKSFAFKKENYTVDSFTKTLVNVNSTFGTDKEEITRNIDFVLRYW